MDSCSRASCSVDLPGIRVSNIGELIAAFPAFQTSSPPLVGDLSLGSWRGLDLFEDLSRQLSLIPPEDLAHNSDHSAEQLKLLSYQNLVGQGIDSEAKGELSVRLAFSCSRLIASKVRDCGIQQIVIIWGSCGTHCEDSEAYFVRFLKWWLEDSKVKICLVVIGAGPTPLPEEFNISWASEGQVSDFLKPEKSEVLLGLMPGVVTSQDLEKLGEAKSVYLERVINLNGDQYLIPPEFRLQVGPSRLLFDKLANLIEVSSPLQAYAQVHGNNFFVNTETLVTAAWKCFAKGATELSIKYMTRALECSRNVVRNGFTIAQLQGMRISSQRFSEVSSVSDPDESLPPALRSFLYQAKGWGCVMVGRHPEAQEYLSQSIQLAGENMDLAEKCYCENINALNELRGGNLEKAFKAEKGIEKVICEANGSVGSVDHRLIYINCINLARLYRRMGDLRNAREYFDQAFKQSLGNLTENDHIYWDACLAQLDADEGDHASALKRWLRVAINWLASELPEAIGDRTIRSITRQREYSQASKIDVTTGALIDTLLEAAGDSGVPIEPKGLVGSRSPIISTTDMVPENILQQGQVVCLNELVVIKCPSIVRAPIGNANLQSLRCLVHELIQCIWPWHAPVGLDEMIVIDRRRGMGIGQDILEAAESAVWHKIGALVSGSQKIALSGVSRGALFQESTLRLGPAVSEFDPELQLVSFKRYRIAQALTSEEKDAVSLINGKSLKVRQALDYSVDEKVLTGLINDRVLDFSLDKKICWKVGIR